MQIGRRFCHVSHFKQQNTPFQAKNSVSGEWSSPSGVPPKPIPGVGGVSPSPSPLSTPSESAHAFSQNSSQVTLYGRQVTQMKDGDLQLYSACGYANLNRGLVRFHSDTTSYVTTL